MDGRKAASKTRCNLRAAEQREHMHDAANTAAPGGVPSLPDGQCRQVPGAPEASQRASCSSPAGLGS